MKNKSIIIRLDPDTKHNADIALAAAGLKYQTVGELFFKSLGNFQHESNSTKIALQHFLIRCQNDKEKTLKSH